MSTVHAPTLTYPNGGETLVSPTITITWRIPHVVDDEGLPVWFEVYFTVDYRYTDEPDWVKVATLPVTASRFVWQVGNFLDSDHVRVAVRACNGKGERSPFSVSAADFSVRRSSLPVPRVISPKSGGRYDNVIEVIVTDGGSPGRQYYNLYYSSTKAAVPLTTIAQAVPSVSLPFRWDVSQFRAADDYNLYVETVDRGGNTSQTVTVPISIAHEGLFLLDTLPPETSVRITSGEQFTRSTVISVSVYASDATTGVQAIQLKESADGAVPTPPQANKTATGFTLSGGDGVKTISLWAQDFGGNRNDLTTKRIFTDAMYLQGDSSVVDFDSMAVGELNLLYVVTRGTQQALFEIDQFSRRLATFTDTPTSVATYVNSVYVATSDSSRTGHLLVYTLTGMEDVAAVSSLFTTEDSYVVDMVTFEDRLYAVASDARLIAFNGSVASVVTTLPYPPASLRADDSLLFVTFQNNTNIYVYDGNTFSEVTT